MKNWILLTLLAVVGCTHHKPPRKIQSLYAAKCVVEGKRQIEGIYDVHLRVLSSTYPKQEWIMQPGFEFTASIDEDTWTRQVKGNAFYLLQIVWSDGSLGLFQGGDPKREKE